MAAILVVLAGGYILPSTPMSACPRRVVSPLMEQGIESLPVMMPKQKTWMPKVWRNVPKFPQDSCNLTSVRPCNPVAHRSHRCAQPPAWHLVCVRRALYTTSTLPP